MSEEKNRFVSYRSSQSPEERENRLRCNKVRMQLKRSSESSEIHDERVESNTLLKSNLRHEFSDEIPAEDITVVETPPKMFKENLEEKNRLREYRSSQSPLDRDNRLSCQRDRTQLNRSIESDEIRVRFNEKR